MTRAKVACSGTMNAWSVPEAKKRIATTHDRWLQCRHEQWQRHQQRQRHDRPVLLVHVATSDGDDADDGPDDGRGHEHPAPAVATRDRDGERLRRGDTEAGDGAQRHEPRQHRVTGQVTGGRREVVDEAAQTAAAATGDGPQLARRRG